MPSLPEFNGLKKFNIRHRIYKMEYLAKLRTLSEPFERLTYGIRKMAALKKGGHFNLALCGRFMSLLLTRDSQYTATFRSASSPRYRSNAHVHPSVFQTHRCLCL
jgi:hypothetical protein